jgi:hypothetical protein
MGDNYTLLDRPRLNEDIEKKLDTGERWYVTPRGISLPSVTTITKLIPNPGLTRFLKTLDKKQLVEWVVKNRGVLNGLDAESRYILDDAGLTDLLMGLKFKGNNDAALKGNVVHAYFERRLLGLETQCPTPEWDATLSALFAKFESEFEWQVLAVEPQLMNYGIGYAGSADAILMIRKRDAGGAWLVAVVDWKSGNSLYGSVARQILMYRKCTRMLDTEGNEVDAPETDTSLGIWLRPPGFAVYPLADDESVWKECYAAVLLHKGTERRREWGMRGQPINSDPIKTKGKDWPALPAEEFD